MKSKRATPGMGTLQRAIVSIVGWALSACAAGIDRAQPAPASAEVSTGSASAYAGWRVFQDRCAACHGPAATGTAGGPDLLPSVREMAPRRFVALVLNRYELGGGVIGPDKDSPGRAAWIDAVVQRKEGALTMPVWKDEPRVGAHVMDLYAYLAARADGTQGPGRPRR